MKYVWGFIKASEMVLRFPSISLTCGLPFLLVTAGTKASHQGQ